MNTTTVAFPGLGIEEFTFSRVAFTLFGRPVYWYGVVIMLGIIAAFAHALYRSRQERVSLDDLTDYALFVILFGIIGARAMYVLTRLDTGWYRTFKDVIAIWNGGLAIYGGIIAGILTIAVISWIKKINVFRLFDMIGPGVGLAQAIGRWGNFANGEAFGEIVPEGHPLYFLRMGIISEFTGTGSVMNYYHPTFLYESVWNVIGFIWISILYKHKKFNGQMALCYLTWYGFGRMFIEGLRTDSLYVGSIRVSQLIGFLFFVFGAAALTVGFIMTAKGKMPEKLFAPNLDMTPLFKKKAVEVGPAADGESAQTPAQPSDAPVKDGDAIPDDTPAGQENTAAGNMDTEDKHGNSD